MSIRRTDDIDEIRALYNECLPPDSWEHDEHEHWLVHNTEWDVNIGFCSAIYWPELDSVFLSAAGILQDWRGHGLQRRMIDVRTRWARQQGARYVVTYTAPNNFASLYILMRKGFNVECYKGWNVFALSLDGIPAWPSEQFWPDIKEKLVE